MPDLNANDVDQAAKIIEGTARSMGVEVQLMPKHGKRYRANLEKVDREHQYSPARGGRARQGLPDRPSSTRPSRCTSAPA